MGGKNPLVVLDDADLERAVACAIDGAFYATGQRCTASSRIIVTEGIHDRFVEAHGRTRAIAASVGDALDPDTQIGPAVSEQQLEQNLRYVEIARDEGGKVLTGGEPLTLGQARLLHGADGDRRHRARPAHQLRGSVRPGREHGEGQAIMRKRWRSPTAAQFGLSAGIVTNSLKHARHFRRQVRAGMVMVNLPTAGVDYHVPFGGTRKSSYGAREQGFAAVEFYTQTKTVYIGG